MEILADDIKSKLYRYCAYQERCKWDIRKKLKTLDVESKLMDGYIQHLIEERFVDEGRYVEAFVKGKLRQNGWGRKRIMQELQMRQIPSELVLTGFDLIGSMEFDTKLQSILRAKNRNIKTPDEYIRKNKLIQFALGKGFDLDSIKKQLPAILAGKEEE